MIIRLPILPTSHIHFSLKEWENASFERGSERVKIGEKWLRYLPGYCPSEWWRSHHDRVCSVRDTSLEQKRAEFSMAIRADARVKGWYAPFFQNGDVPLNRVWFSDISVLNRVYNSKGKAENEVTKGVTNLVNGDPTSDAAKTEGNELFASRSSDVRPAPERYTHFFGARYVLSFRWCVSLFMEVRMNFDFWFLPSFEGHELHVVPLVGSFHKFDAGLLGNLLHGIVHCQFLPQN